MYATISYQSVPHREWWRDLNRHAEKSIDPGVILVITSRTNLKSSLQSEQILISNQARIVSVIAGGAAYRWTTQVKNVAKSRSVAGEALPRLLRRSNFFRARSRRSSRPRSTNAVRAYEIFRDFVKTGLVHSGRGGKELVWQK